MTVDTMQLEQTMVEAGAPEGRQMTATARRLVLAYVGAGAYLLDGMTAVYRRGERLLASAEKRGASMERGVRRRFNRLEEQAVHEVRKLQGQAEDGFQQVRDLQAEEMEKRVELALASMGLPSRERLERLSEEIDSLNQKLDAQILRLPAEPIPDPLG